jgi:autoinducer 2-degrading protein
MPGLAFERIATLSRIALVPTFTIAEGRLDDFLERVTQQREDCLALEPGCSHFDVLVVETKPNTVLLYEIYADAAAVAAHRQYPHYKAFKAATADMVAAVDVVEWTIL